LQDFSAIHREEKEPEVLVKRSERVMTIILNRPHEINALTTEMVRLIRQALEEARTEDHFQFVLVSGAGGRGFCSGGDLKMLAEAAKEKDFERTGQFFREEYALDLYIHRFPKPVVVMAEGVTMGGGLGLAAGADIVVVTERTLMAMPETRIGFFPDVGSTGWMFTKCPAGYPEYLGLTGYEMKGIECVRLGLAHCFAGEGRLQELKEVLANYPERLSSEKKLGVVQLKSFISLFIEKVSPSNLEMDEWIAKYFSGKDSVLEIMALLFQCSSWNRFCEDAYHRMTERSPTALVLTLRLLRHNEGRPLEEVFPIEAKATRFIISHPDYIEGIRAYILDKDEKPHWQPPTITEVSLLELDLRL
jgi:enoyl-CoA hydratase